MKALTLILALALAGCAGRHKPPPQTASVRASGRVVSERLGSATTRARVLHQAVPIDLRPAVEQLQDDLLKATEAIAEQGKAVEVLERDIVIQTRQLAEARKERDAAIADRNRWRKVSAWIGAAALLMALLMALWIFRKPIMRLIVGPIPL